jgi:putative Ca2+/H+ antiporter (TMEM165/GDT1 family)
MLGILLATIVNHALAATAGVGRPGSGGGAPAGSVGLGFIAFGVWTLVPDRAGGAMEPRPVGAATHHRGAVLPGRDGDKTAGDGRPRRAAGAPLQATAGTTLGMLLAADGLAVGAGARFADRVRCDSSAAPPPRCSSPSAQRRIAAALGWW